MAEEYKRKWHEQYDPEADDRQYLGTRIMDTIDKQGGEALKNWWEDERKLEGWEYLNPVSHATFLATRGVETAGKVITAIPGAKPVFRTLAQGQDIAAGAVGDLVGKAGIDPRIGGWSTRIATDIALGKGIGRAAKATGVTTKVAKGATRVKRAAGLTAKEAAERIRARRAHKWTRSGDTGTPIDKSDVWGPDDLTGPKKTYTRITDPKETIPIQREVDPWNLPPKSDLTVGMEEYRRRVGNDLLLKIEEGPPAPIPAWGKPGDTYGSLKFNPIGKDFDDYVETDLTELDREIKASLQDPGGTLEGGKYYWTDPAGRQRASTSVFKEKGGKWRKSDFERFSNENKRAIRRLLTHLSNNDIEIHHVNTLDTGAALHENFTRRGRLLTRARLFEVSGIASGNNPLNRLFLPGRVHDVAHAWVTDNVGNQSWRILGKPGSAERRRWVQLPFDHPERLAKIDEYGALIKQSQEEIARIYRAYTELWTGTPTAEGFEELLKRLKLTEKEYDMLITPEGGSAFPSDKKVRALIREIDEDRILKERQATLNRPQPDTSVSPVKRKTPREEAKARLNEKKEEWRDRNKKGSRLTKEEKKQLKADIEVLENEVNSKQGSLFDLRIFKTKKE